jgi:DNA-directed RNA polymerase subunit RPC12/RpoP
MRPNKSVTEAELYECLECGARAEADESGVCEDCGGELLHLGRSRDL